MAITFWWLGHATTTAARVCVRGTTNGVVSVSAGGAIASATLDTSVADGVVTIDLVGLSPNTTYPLTITDASAATAAGVVRTMPAAGGKVAFISCPDRTRAMDDLAQNIIAFGAHAVKHQGDYIYCSTALASYNGETTTTVATGSTVATYAAHWRQCARKSENRLLETALPQYRMFDDHEFGGDNWDHSVTQAQASPNVASGGTQAEVDAAWWTARQAAGYYLSGNPAHIDGASAEKPGAAAGGTSVSQYPVSYYRFTVGDIEVFCIDCFSYRSILTATDNASKTMLGANQKAWLKARLDSSTARFKIISSGKTVYAANSAGTGDDWLKYTTERAELLSYISANASGNLRGVVWMCGDAHGAFVAYDPANGHISVCANPAGVDHIAQTVGYQANIMWKEGGNSGVSTTLPACFGLCEVVGTKLLIRLINQYGAVLWSGSVEAGTNALRSPA
jgi:phosphodiesterase/alkaline phosphatase D-like protein